MPKALKCIKRGNDMAMLCEHSWHSRVCYVNIVGILGYVVPRLCLGVHSVVCVVSAA